MRFPILVVLASALAAWPVVSQNWEQADVATVRLKPAAFESLSPPLRQELDRQGCLVPQSYVDRVPHNVIRGRFTSKAQMDIAVLCSRERASSILVFHGGSATAATELAKRADADFLQVVASGGVVGYSRALGLATPKYIQEHREQFGGLIPPRLDHDGINDLFVGKASVVWYWFGDRWLQLKGAD